MRDHYDPSANGGRDRTDVEYNWPRTLHVPPQPPRLIYFDLNHWVALSKAVSGHPGGESYGPILAACERAAQENRAAFPISDTIFMEISKIGQHRQRRSLRQAIERLSGFVAVAARSLVSRHEIEAMLDAVLGPRSHPIGRVDYVGHGVNWALGFQGFRVTAADGRNVTAEVRSSHARGAAWFDERIAEAELELSRYAIEGPAPGDEAKLQELGYNPYAAFRVAHARATQEIEQVERFNRDPAWRAGRIRDAVAARETLIEINSMLFQGLAARGVSLEEAFPRPEHARRAFDSMPSFDVSVSLKTSYHRDPNHQWTPNDIHDIDALGSTLPYCDIVVTDKAAAAHVKRTGLATRLNTIVLSSLLALPAFL